MGITALKVINVSIRDILYHSIKRINQLNKSFLSQSLFDTRASDVYSYGLIIWQTFSFEHPLPNIQQDHRTYHFLNIKQNEKMVPHLIPDCVPEKMKNILKSCFL